MTYIPSFPATNVNQIDTYRFSGTRYDTGLTTIGYFTIDNTWRYVRGMFTYALRRYPTSPWLWFERGEFVWDLQRWGNLQPHYYCFNGTSVSNNAGGTSWYARGYGDSSKLSILVRDVPGENTIQVMSDDIEIIGYSPSTSPTYSEVLAVRIRGDNSYYCYVSMLLIAYREV